jgi:hypothetical protein
LFLIGTQNSLFSLLNIIISTHSTKEKQVFNSVQGVDTILGGFNAGMNAIRERREERDNIAYFAGRCRAMEEWGESWWEVAQVLRAENGRLRAANDALKKNAAAQARGHLGFRDLLANLIRDRDMLRQDNARLKSQN